MTAQGGGPAGACEGHESFALQVLGPSMAPVFDDGDIVVIEPGGAAREGDFVLAWLPDEGWLLRQLVRAEEGCWALATLLPGDPPRPIEGLEAVRGVVIQKAVPGRRRASRRLV